jgi:hypothetical protein
LTGKNESASEHSIPVLPFFRVNQLYVRHLVNIGATIGMTALYSLGCCYQTWILRFGMQKMRIVTGVMRGLGKQGQDLSMLSSKVDNQMEVIAWTDDTRQNIV